MNWRLTPYFAALFVLLLPIQRSVITEQPDLRDAGSQALETEHSGPVAGHPDEFIRYYNRIRTVRGSTSPAYEPGYQVDELRDARRANAIRKSGSTDLPWKERGPGNVGGRTRSIVVDAADAGGDTWFAASVGGGIWKTSDRGLSWTHITKNLPNLAFSSLAQSPDNPDILYAGSGEGFFNGDAIEGAGIFKSTDHGDSWTQLPETAEGDDFAYVNRLIVHPGNADVVVAATREGLFRTADGGATWSRRLEARGRTGYTQVLAEPGAFRTQYAAETGFGVWKSTDAGRTWSFSSRGLAHRTDGAITVSSSVAGSRFELGISPAMPGRLLAIVESSSETDALYLSDDRGDLWHPVPPESGSGPDIASRQGWYDLTVAGHPYDENVFFVGGVRLYRVDLTGEASVEARVTTDDSETRHFQTFIDFGGRYLRGGLRAGVDDEESTIAQSEMTSVEIRYGAGRSQMAHRFTPPDGQGIDFADYPYADYTEVPFEVWDVSSERQLMVSFRDRLGDGQYNLIHRDDQNLGREYVLVHAVDYDPNGPDPTISSDGGLPHDLMYFFWPILAPDATWDPSSMPAMTLRFDYFDAGVATANRAATIGSIHVDQHVIVTIEDNPTTEEFDVIVGNDGGIYYSGDGGQNWINRNNQYNTAQFYGVDAKPEAPIYIGGTQDNGTWRSFGNPSASTGWISALGGDGFETAWHQSDDRRMAGTIQYNQIRRSVDGGINWTAATTGLTDVGDSDSGAPFMTSLTRAPGNSDVLFTLGQSGVWKSTNFAETWTLKSIPADRLGFTSRGEVRVSLASDDVVWAGFFLSGGTGQTLQLSTDGGETFQSVHGPSYAPGHLSGLATHPSDEATAYALFSAAGRAKILRTTDFGQNWEDLSGFARTLSKDDSPNGFPNVAVYDLLVHPQNTNVLWAGTEIGLFISENNGESWHIADSGLPSTAIWRLRAVNDEIIVATHGRGVWTVPIDATITDTDTAPEGFQLTLEPGFPNPFSGYTTIEFSLDRPGPVSLRVYDLTGRLVAILDDGEKPAGRHRVTWTPRNLASGHYLLRLSSGSRARVRTVAYLK